MRLGTGAISRGAAGIFAGVMAVSVVAQPVPVHAAEGRAAKELFGVMALPSAAAPAPHGSYAKGCIAGASQIAADGPAWQAMRLSRNRRYGHPQMIALLEQFSRDAQKIGWPGLLLGDISQPRGGPMLSGHASHQIGLDADIWFTPMPDRTLSAQERESLPFTSMLDKSKFLTVDSRRWSQTHARLLIQAASYPQVDRVFVNPAIKKKLCDTWTGDRSSLGKIRPVYGHDEHFHIRIKCPAGSSGCKPQAAVPAGDGCDSSLAWWFTKEPWAPPKKDPSAKPVKPRVTTLADLPAACSVVLASPAAGSAANTVAPALAGGSSTGIEAVIGRAGDAQLPSSVPVPLARPSAR